MWLGHVSVPGGRALLSHLAIYEQIAPGACEGAPACLLAVLQRRDSGGGGGSSQQTSCHGEMVAAKWEMSVRG